MLETTQILHQKKTKRRTTCTSKAEHKSKIRGESLYIFLFPYDKNIKRTKEINNKTQQNTKNRKNGKNIIFSDNVIVLFLYLFILSKSTSRKKCHTYCTMHLCTFKQNISTHTSSLSNQIKALASKSKPSQC